MRGLERDPRFFHSLLLFRLDEDQQEELHEYFMEAENNDIPEAVEEFDGEYEEDDLRIFRIKFMSEVAN